MLSFVERHFSLNEEVIHKPTAIVAISYGACVERLTIASFMVQREAILTNLIKGFSCPILWCEFAHNPEAGIERLRKRNLFAGVPNFYAGLATSTTDECEAVIKTAKEKGISLENIVVVAWSSHSRRAGLVWKHYLPNSQIVFRAVKGPAGNDIENPMKLQRSWRTWLLVNMALFPFYKFFPGVGWFAKQNFRQPT